MQFFDFQRLQNDLSIDEVITRQKIFILRRRDDPIVSWAKRTTTTTTTTTAKYDVKV